MHRIKGCYSRHHKFFRTLLTQPNWTLEAHDKLPSTMKNESAHAQWRMNCPSCTGKAQGVAWCDPPSSLGGDTAWGSHFWDADFHEKTPGVMIFQSKFSKMSQRNTFPISPFLRCILESVFSHLFQMPRPHEWLLWHRSTLTSHWSQLLSVVQRLEKNKSKQNLVFQGAIYVGQDLASTTSPSASRTESYLIISMATAVGLE